MSASQPPISAARFAEALRDLPLSSLSLKALEIRNSIAHLDYSNGELKPFADGTAAGAGGVADQDCVDAIRENEVVISRMLERIELLKTEVESRGASWDELGGGKAEEEKEEGTGTAEEGLNGTESESRPQTTTAAGVSAGARSSAWTDGTFQTGRIVNGEVRMDGAGAAAPGSVGVGNVHGNAVNGSSSNAGGRLDDDALRRAMEDRMRQLAQEDEEEDGMHL